MDDTKDPIKSAVKRAYDVAEKELSTFEKDMERQAKIIDLAPDMFCALKDIAGGSYTEKEVIDMAQQVVDLVEDKWKR